jgi:hypothetical protein
MIMFATPHFYSDPARHKSITFEYFSSALYVNMIVRVVWQIDSFIIYAVDPEILAIHICSILVFGRGVPYEIPVGVIFTCINRLSTFGR